MSDSELVDHFIRYFYLRRAVSDSAKRLAYRVRYQVYCTELGFEDPEQFSDGCEFDECDHYSEHFLIFHRGLPDEVAGTVRLVVPSNANQILPIQLHCLEAIDPAKFSPSRLVTGECAELSRLAVTNHFRRRKGELVKPFGLNEGSRFGFANFPYIAVGLYMAAATACYSRGIGMVVVMMEPRLARHLARFGILFEQIGQQIDFHGRRAPYAISEESFFKWIKAPLLALYEYVGQEIGQPGSQI